MAPGKQGSESLIKIVTVRQIGQFQNYPIFLDACFLQVLLCGSVVISYFLGAKRGMALLIESTAFVTLFFCFVHYTNRAIILKQKNEALELEKKELKTEEKPADEKESAEKND